MFQLYAWKIHKPSSQGFHHRVQPTYTTPWTSSGWFRWSIHPIDLWWKVLPCHCGCLHTISGSVPLSLQEGSCLKRELQSQNISHWQRNRISSRFDHVLWSEKHCSSNHGIVIKTELRNVTLVYSPPWPTALLLTSDYQSFWSEAIRAANHVKNRIPNSKVKSMALHHGMSPYL